MMLDGTDWVVKVFVPMGSIVCGPVVGYTLAAGEGSAVTTAEAPELGAVATDAGPEGPGAVATAVGPVAEAALFAGDAEEALAAPVAVGPPLALALAPEVAVGPPLALAPEVAVVAPVAVGLPLALAPEVAVAAPVAVGPPLALAPEVAVAAPDALAVAEAPLTEEPVAATPVAEEAPAVEAPVTPLATDLDADSTPEAVLVADAPETGLPDGEPTAVGGRLAVPDIDAPVAVAVPETLSEVPDPGSDSVPVGVGALLSPDKVGATEPPAVDDRIVEGPKTILPLDVSLGSPDVSLDNPDVGRRPETSDAAVETIGIIVLPPAVTAGALEPETGTAVGAGALKDDAGLAVTDSAIEFMTDGPFNVGLTLGCIIIGGTPLLEAELVVGITLPVVGVDKML